MDEFKGPGENKNYHLDTWACSGITVCKRDCSYWGKNSVAGLDRKRLTLRRSNIHRHHKSFRSIVYFITCKAWHDLLQKVRAGRDEDTSWRPTSTHLKIIRIEMSVTLIDAILLTEATEVDNGLAY
jgi:hypothetical protein